MDSIFIPGWEFNRIFAESPTDGVQSALPANLLWNGCAQLWMFENVYCTQESYIGECKAHETLKWKSGLIFKDLKELEIIQTFDWKDLDRIPSYSASLNEIHSKLRAEYKVEELKSDIEKGDNSIVEKINSEILKPALQYLNCINNINPSNINHWFRPERTSEEIDRLDAGIRTLLEPIEDGRIQTRASFPLCPSPAHATTQEEQDAQKEDEEAVQNPKIAPLMVGELLQDEYHDQVLKESKLSVYEPFNEAMWAQYRENIKDLIELRRLAKKHLWKDLHGDWFPQLQEDPSFLPEFQSRVRTAVNNSAMGAYLRTIGTLSMFTLGGVAAYHVASDIESPFTQALVAGAVTGAAVKIAGDEMERRRSKSKNLTLFYQSLSERLPRI